MQPLWNIVCRFLKKLNIELPYDSVISLLGIYQKKKKEKKKLFQKDACTPEFITALFTIVKKKQPKCPSADEWIKKTW